MNTQFGLICPYKVTLCQEREGCSNCGIYLDRGKKTSDFEKLVEVVEKAEKKRKLLEQLLRQARKV